MDLGRVLRTAREVRGVSLAALAARTHYSKALLGHLETGRRVVRLDHVRAYEEALGIRIDTAGRTVEPADVELLGQAVDLVTAIGLRHGGLASAELASAQWTWAQDLLNRPMPDTIRRPLAGRAARLADRLAWSLGDIGRTDRATAVYDTALSLAERDRAVWTAIAVNLANHHTTTGRPAEGLALLDTLGAVEPVLDFTAHSARARAFATTGEWEPTLRHVGIADEAHARVDLDTLPDTHRPFVSGHAAHADNEAGKALVLLAERGHRRAVPVAVERLSRARSLFGPDRARARARCAVRLASLDG